MYGSNVDLLSPPSIKIVLPYGVSINVLSPCPTSIKCIFKFFGIIFKVQIIIIGIKIIDIYFFLFCLNLYLNSAIKFLTLLPSSIYL